MKRLFIILLSMLLLTSCSTSLAKAYSVSYNQVSYTYEDLDTLNELIAEQFSIMSAANRMAEAGRELGYSEDHEVIKLAQKEYKAAKSKYSEYKKVYDDLMTHWHQKEEEYPVATYVWSYLKDLGYNNQVCAGILGNMMREVGGGTLDLQSDMYYTSHYGICQWSNKYYPEMWGASLEEQCNFLRDTIRNEFSIFGSNYKKGFTYDNFVELKNVKETAKAFALCYERNGGGDTNLRIEYAITAYNYFVS